MRQNVLPYFDPTPPAERKFLEFHADHPEVEREMLRLARRHIGEAKSKGGTHIGVRLIWEIMRWHFYYVVDEGQEFKLSNNHTPYYSRQLMRKYPELRGWFRTKGDD